MIFITGDTHGDFTRIEQFCVRFMPTREDTMIILGDVGFNYYGVKRDIKVKEKMARLPITILSMYGNHEMRPETIPSYHFAEWHDGKVYIEDRYPNLLFAVDGEVYDLDGKKLIVIGGAYQNLDGEAKKAYQYYEYSNPAGNRAIMQEFKQAVMDRIIAYNRNLSWKDENLSISAQNVRVLILEE